MTGRLFVAVGVPAGDPADLAWRAGWNLGALWPIIVMAVGVNQIVAGSRRRDGTAGWGISLVLTGVVLLLHTEQILRSVESWPLFIVAHGIGLSAGRGGHGVAGR